MTNERATKPSRPEGLDKIIADVEAERSALAVMMIRPSEDIYEATGRLSVDSFYTEKYRTVFLAIKKLVADGEKVDIMSVLVCINSSFNAAVSGYELTQIADGDTSMRLSSLVEVLETYRQKREIQLLAKKVLFEIPESGFSLPDDVVRLSDRLLAIVEGGAEESTTLADEMKQLLSDEDDVVPGIKVGINLIDKMGGFDVPSMTILGAYFSHGKSMLSVNMALNAVRLGAKVAYYSLEMSNRQLTERMLANLSGVPAHSIRMRSYSIEQRYDLESTFDKYGVSIGRNIFFDFCRESSLESIMLSIRRMKNKYGVNLVFIDHFMLMNLPSEKGENEERIQARAGRLIFNLSRDVGVAIVVLWQLNKEASRGQTPLVSSLRGSGQPAEAADNIFLLYDPHHEDENFQFPEPFAKYSTDGYVYLNAAKCRNYTTSAELLKSSPAISLMSSLPPGETPPLRSDYTGPSYGSYRSGSSLPR